jgi:hypothetical protein
MMMCWVDMVIASQYKTWSKKTYNNKISVLRRAFEFGYRDHPDHAIPPGPSKAHESSGETYRELTPFESRMPKR